MIDNIVDFVTWRREGRTQGAPANEPIDKRENHQNAQYLCAQSADVGVIGEDFGDRINDDIYMAKVERRVSGYLDRIHQSQKDGKFSRIVGEGRKTEKISSWDQIHIPHAHSRHVYFAGMPLTHSKEVVQLQRNEWRIGKQVEELLLKIKERDEHINELINKESVNFLKYEAALRKAMYLGMGCNIIIETLDGAMQRQKRCFFKITRANAAFEMHRSLQLQASHLRKKHKLAILVMTRGIRVLLESTMRESLLQMRIAKSTLPLKTHQMHVKEARKRVPGPLHAKQIEIIKGGINTVNGTNVIESVEESLLRRLEHLVAEEMEVLSGRQTVI